MKKVLVIILCALLIIWVSISCIKQSTDNALILATTTSLQDSGLLSYLLPKFTKETGIKVKPIAVGSGEALKMGVRGDADIILAHSPDKEKELIASGKALRRTPFMFNYFAIAGPASDPAHISGSKSAEQAFKKINESKNIFVSRADDSGTHKKELKIWEESGVTPKGDSYVKTGQGMAETLNVANEKEGYALTDKATFITNKGSLDKLIILLANKKALKNTYSIIELNAKKLKIHGGAAKEFKKWILSKKTQKNIASFGQERYGKPLFMLIN